jgi:hypothetical protein
LRKVVLIVDFIVTGFAVETPQPFTFAPRANDLSSFRRPERPGNRL